MEEFKHSKETHDGIALSELLLSIWRHKVLVIVPIIIGVVLSAIISLLAQKPVYESKLNMTIDLPKTYMTRYGMYELPALTSEYYAELIRNSFVLTNTARDLKPDYDLSPVDIKNMVSVSLQPNSKTSFDVRVSAGEPELAYKTAQAVFDSFIEYINAVVRENALNYFMDYFSVGLESTTINLELEKGILKDYEVLLAKTPKFINTDELQSSISGDGHYLIVENVINPGYTKLETDIIAKQQDICTLENALNIYKSNLSEINKEKDAVARYYETGEPGHIESSVINVVQRSVILTSQPTQGVRKSPNYVKDVMFGALLGAVLGLGIVLTKGWLEKSLNANKVR